MTANTWYCIAQTSTFDTSCSINVAFDGYDIQFSASVRFGVSSINITRCNLPSDIVFSLRLREIGTQWFIDLFSSREITPNITIADSSYWQEANTTAGAGTITLVLSDITSKFNTAQGGGTGGLDIEQLRGFLLENGYTALLDYWKIDEVDNTVLRTKYNVVSLKEIISQRRATGAGSGTGSGYGRLDNWAEWDAETMLTYVLSAKLGVSLNERLKYVEQNGSGLNEDDLKKYLDDNKYLQEGDIAELKATVDGLDDLLNGGTKEVIDTWNEVVSFLDGYKDSEDLATILSGMNTDIANRVLIEDFEKLEEAVLAIDISGLSNRLDVAEQAIKTNATAIATNATNITNLNKRVKTLEDLGLTLEGDAETGYYIKSAYSFVSQGEIISGRRASGSSSDVTGGGGISQVTAQMIADALGYVPYSSQNPSGYITSAALNGYATQAWVENKKYLTAIPSEYITETELSNTLGGYQSKITSSNKLAYSLISGTPSSLPASDVYNWAKAAVKPSYTASEVGALSTGGGTLTGGLTISSGNLLVSKTAGDVIVNQLYPTADNTYLLGHSGRRWSDLYTVLINGGTPINSNNYSSYALPLSGGTLNSDSYSPLIINTTNSQNRVQFKVGGVDKALVGWNPTYGAWLYNYPGNSYLHIKDDGTPCYNGNTLIHSGNIGEQKVERAKYIETLAANGASWYGDGYRIYGQWASETVLDWKVDGYEVRVDKAKKLNTARTIWGKSFDGTGNVDGIFTMSNKLLIYPGTNLFVFGNETTDTYLRGNNVRLQYGSSAVQGLILNSSGNVLIGTTTDSGSGAKLQVSGNLTATGEVISTRRATSSDARLKDNINRLLAEDCLAMVRNLHPSSWDWKENGEHSIGFIAQDVEQYMSYAVTRTKDDVLGQRLNLQYDQFFAPVVGAIQCLDVKVNSHEDEIEGLKKRVKYLENKLQEYGYNRY